TCCRWLLTPSVSAHVVPVNRASPPPFPSGEEARGIGNATPIVRRTTSSTTIATNPLTRGYDTGGFYDEMFAPEPGGGVVPRPHYRPLAAQLAGLGASDLRNASDLANRSFLHQGITFTVYSDS